GHEPKIILSRPLQQGKAVAGRLATPPTSTRVTAMTFLPAHDSPLRRVPGGFSSELRPADHIIRSVLATARGAGDPSAAAKAARALWPDDMVTRQRVTRARTRPADTTSSGWAADVGTFALADFVATMGGASSTLLTRALQLSFGDAAAIVVPNLVASSASATFRQQSQPIPVISLD